MGMGIFALSVVLGFEDVVVGRGFYFGDGYLYGVQKMEVGLGLVIEEMKLGLLVLGQVIGWLNWSGVEWSVFDLFDWLIERKGT